MEELQVEGSCRRNTGRTLYRSPLWIRVTQLIFCAVVLGTSSYTLSVFTDWNHVRFTVAGSALVFLSLLFLTIIPICPLCVKIPGKPLHNPYIHLILEVISWHVTLAIWICLVVNIAKDLNCYVVAPTSIGGEGSGHSTSRPCDCIYAAMAFAIVLWCFLCLTFFTFVWIVVTQKESVLPLRKLLAWYQEHHDAKRGP